MRRALSRVPPFVVPRLHPHLAPSTQIVHTQRYLSSEAQRNLSSASVNAEGNSASDKDGSSQKALIVTGLAMALTVGLGAVLYKRTHAANKLTKLDELKVAWEDELAAQGVVTLGEREFLDAMLKELPTVADQALEEGWLRSIFRPNQQEVTLQFADYAFLEALANVEKDRLLTALHIFAQDEQYLTLIELRKVMLF
jgi:hypothetical protein